MQQNSKDHQTHFTPSPPLHCFLPKYSSQTKKPNQNHKPHTKYPTIQKKKAWGSIIFTLPPLHPKPKKRTLKYLLPQKNPTATKWTLDPPSHQKTQHLLKLSKGPKAKNCHPNPSRYQKNSTICSSSYRIQEGKKREKRCIQMLQATKILNIYWRLWRDKQQKTATQKSFKLPKTQQSAEASSSFLFWKNPTLIQTMCTQDPSSYPKPEMKLSYNYYYWQANTTAHTQKTTILISSKNYSKTPSPKTGNPKCKHCRSDAIWVT